MEQGCEPTDRNWINRRQGRTSLHEITKSISIKGLKRKSSGCALKVAELTPGGLLGWSGIGTGGIVRFHNAQQESAEGIVGGRPPKA